MHDDVTNYSWPARSNSMSKPVYQSIRSCLPAHYKVPYSPSHALEENADLMGNMPLILFGLLSLWNHNKISIEVSAMRGKNKEIRPHLFGYVNIKYTQKAMYDCNEIYIFLLVSKDYLACCMVTGQSWTELYCLLQNFIFLSLLSLSLLPTIQVGFSSRKEKLWSLTGCVHALMLSLPIHSERSRPSSSFKWADISTGRLAECWGQGHRGCPLAQCYPFLVKGWES